MKRTASTLPTSRITILRILLILVTIITLGRFFQVAVLEHTKALTVATTQYRVKQTIIAKRGKIYMSDLTGGPNFPVALNIDTFMVIADPFLLNDPGAIALALSPVLQQPIPDLLGKLSDKKKRYIILKKKLTKNEADAVTNLNLKGISLATVPTRYYPESSLAAQVIGFVNADGEGTAGLEQFFNEDLKGYDGSIIGEKDAKHRIISEGKSASPKNGTNLVLTIDHSIQYIVEQKLSEAMKTYEADGGSVIIQDIKTGAILALANQPSFDLNNYNQVPTEAQNLFVDKAVSTPWEPGSIFKPFTLAAGIDLGLFKPDTQLILECTVKVNGFEIHNAEDKCYVRPDIRTVLTQSINIGTIWAATQIGNDNFAQYLTAFGFGNRTGIELQPESSGKILPLKQWQDVNRATISFGQGLSVTPLQIVAGYAAIANEGKLMKPYIVAKRIESNGHAFETQPKEVRQVIKPDTAKLVTGMLKDVVTDGHGKRAVVAGYKIAGKTGTAQYVGDDGQYVKNQNIGSFAGFFPADAPQFAMLVKLDRPKAVEFAESSAAPTFGAIAAWLLHYAKIAPTD